MNVFIGSGKIINIAKTVSTNNGKIRILRFTVSATCKHNPDNDKNKTDLIPCIIYNPSKDLEDWFLKQGQDSYVEFEGRVVTFTFELIGEKTCKTEVVVNSRSLNIMLL